MSKALLAAGLLFLLSGSGLANLIVNGDFEQALDVGWRDTVLELGGSSRIERSDTLGSGSGYAAKVFKYLADHASLYQAVAVPGTDLALSLDARLTWLGGSSTCWPVAALFVRYLDSGGAQLGATCFYNHSEYADWQPSDVLHLVEVTSSDWQHYDLHIGDELASNLPGVNAADVSKVCIDLYAYDSGT